MSDQPTISYRLIGLTKIFPGVVAVEDVDLTVFNREIHGIIGKNGAGKTVLMTLIAGVTRATKGEIWIGKEKVHIEHYAPWAAHHLGVSLIPQEPLFASNQSVVDNLFLGIPQKTNLGFLDHKKMAEKVLEIADHLKIQVNPGQRMGSLRIEEQQLLAFGKALYIDKAKVILLDEITASLPGSRKKLLLQFLHEALDKDETISFTLISHQINEILEFCDRVTVLRDSHVVKTLKIPETNKTELAALLVGEEVEVPNHKNGRPVTGPQATADEQELLQVQDISKEAYYTDVSFTLVKGEVLGLAGLDGSGKNEVLEALGGLLKPDSGALFRKGQKINLASPNMALENGISYLPKKREEQAVIHNRPVDENTLLMIYPNLRNKLGMINYKKCDALADEKSKALKVKTPSIKTNIDYLSGGNRQKVILNRVSTASPDIYVLNEPTRGVDIATKPEILSLIRNSFTKNCGIVLTSESEEEMIEVCDRILIFYRGQIQREVRRGEPDFTVAEVYKTIQGVGLP